MEEAIVGIEYGVAVAQALESVAARWIDPRLTGFKVVPLLLQKGGHVLIVHIPPGESRPHRVNHEPSKNWTFFIRHGESIRMMTTQEIRDAALSTLTGEQQARAYAREVCEEQKDELISTEPVFLLQAAPLLRLGSAWDVTNEEFSQVMFGSNNQEEREYFCSNLKRSPTLRGIRTVNAKTNPTMIWEVHRNGYVGAIVKIPPSNHKDDPHLYDTNGKLFLEFAAFCQDALDAAKADFPYLLKATIYNTKDTVLAVLVGVRGQKPSPKYPRTDIRFHELRRGTGQAFKDAVAEWPIC